MEQQSMQERFIRLILLHIVKSSYYHYNDDNSYLFVNGIEKLKFKSSVSYLDRNLLCLGNISSDWSLTSSAKTGLYGNFYDFAIDYVSINGVKTIYDIHRYLMNKHNT